MSACKDKKRNFANIEDYNADGRAPKLPNFKPKSRKDNEAALLRQKLSLEETGQKLIDGLVIDDKNVARRAFGNQAPPLPESTYDEVYQDAVDSSALPEAIYNAAYTRGSLLNAVEEAKKYQEAGAEFERIDRRIRSEEELAAQRSKWTILKGQTVNLPWFDPRMFPPDGTAVFFGRRRSGKSWMMRHLLYLYKHIYRGVIILTNTEQNQFWSAHVPSRFIHKYDPFVIQKIIERQRAVVAWNALNADNPDKQINPLIMIILDDVVSGDMHHDPYLNALFYEGRHSGMCIMISTQHPKALPPGVRSNADLAVIYPMWSEHDLDTIRTQYCTFFEDKNDFYYLARETTQDHTCLCLFLGDPTINPINALYKFKACDPGAFVAGAKEFWENDAEHRKKKLEAMAAILTNTELSGGSQVHGGAPIDMHWLVDDSETEALIQMATF